MFEKCGPSGTECRNRYCYCRCIGGVAMVIAMVLVFGVIVQMLWNWLIPDIFKFGMISYAQALGLIVFARLLFGNVGHHHGHHHFGYGKRWHGPMAWCGPMKGSAGADECGDWRHYDAWWDEEGKESLKRYAERRKAGTDSPAT